MAPRPDEVVVEAGAGTGLLWAENAARLPAPLSLHLTDASAAMCGRLRTAMPPTVTVCRADVQRLPFAPGVADVVLANHMLYHVPDLPAALHELRRVLRAGGRAVMATNGTAHMRELRDLLAGAGVDYDPARVHGAFTLEDGPAAVAEVFSDVRVLRFDDGLRVTEVEPLVAYVMSMDGLTEDRRERVTEVARAAVTRRGHLDITKSSGVVLAR